MRYKKSTINLRLVPFLILCLNSLNSLADSVLYTQNFNSCTGLAASGWTTYSLPAGANWTLGTPTNPDAMGSTMNGSCFVFFDDDLLGNTTQANGVWLRSPSVNTSAYAKITLEFDLHFRKHEVLNSSLEIYVSTSTTVPGTPIATYRENVSGTLYSQNTHQTLDISAFRGSTTYVFFKYKDGGGQSWWAGIDNFEIKGTSSVTCANAETLIVSGNCTSGANALNTFNGTLPSCETDTDGAVWYKFTAPSSNITFTTNATFNDVVTIFSGSCAGLTEIACFNNDVFGFEGESKYLTGLSNGATYYVRISGATHTFGAAQGGFCLSLINGGSNSTPPGNDLCINSVPLIMNQTCTVGQNLFADMDGPIPSLNNKADHSIWYNFTAPASGSVVISSGANFAETLTLFSGNCAGLTEVACNDMGRELYASGLSSGNVYYLQVSSFFNSLWGDVCVRVSNIPSGAPTNDVCSNSTLLSVGATACTSGSNLLATMDGPTPSCNIFPDASIWYRFVAPASGQVRISSGADFNHTVSLYTGSCGSLTQVVCLENPDKCGDPVLVSNLTSGTTYYVQIASVKNAFGYLYGNVCVRITNGNISPVKVKVKAMLEGAYDTNTGLLTNNLNSLGVLPLAQPYSGGPWNYAGQECLNFPPVNMVDWVLVELRSAANSNTVFDKKAAVLLTDGSIVDPGSDGVSFWNVSPASYFIVVRHRNHLDVISSATVAIPNSSAYSFTAAATQAMGTNQLKNLGTGIFALHSGDLNGDGVITVSDYNLFVQQSSFVNGYYPADASLDRSVTVADFNYYQPNASILGVSQIRY